MAKVLLLIFPQIYLLYQLLDLEGKSILGERGRNSIFELFSFSSLQLALLALLSKTVSFLEEIAGMSSVVG